MSLKAVMDMPNLKHTNIPPHLLAANGGHEPKALLKYNSLADLTQQFPELLMVEDAITGFLNGSSFSGSTQCQSAMQGIVYYVFEIINNIQIYEPSKVMKVVIAFQKLQEKNSLFYA